MSFRSRGCPSVGPWQQQVRSVLLREGGKEHNAPVTFDPMVQSFLEVWLSRKLKFFRDMAWRKRQRKQHACGGLPNWPLPKGKLAAIDVNSMLSLLCSAADCCRWCFLNEYIIWVEAVMDQSWSAFYSHFTCCFKDFCIDWCWQNCAGFFLAQVLRLQLPHAVLWN